MHGSRRLRMAVTAGALSLALFAGGCESFDLTDLFPDGKKKLAGDRRPVFPDGVPGVSQGVPPELVKGYQPPEAGPAVITAPPPAAEPEEKPKPASKPKRTAARPKPKPAPAPAQAEPQPQQAAQPAAQSPWPAQTQPQQSAWPAAPAPGTFSR